MCPQRKRVDSKYFVKDVLGDRLKKYLSCIYLRNILKVGVNYRGLKIAGQPSKAVAGGPCCVGTTQSGYTVCLKRQGRHSLLVAL